MHVLGVPVSGAGGREDEHVIIIFITRAHCSCILVYVMAWCGVSTAGKGTSRQSATSLEGEVCTWASGSMRGEEKEGTRSGD